MTVKHLQTVQRSQASLATHSDVNVLHKFKAGFADCTDEVSRYINQIDGVEQSVKQRLIGHLSNCVGGLQQVVPTPFTYGTPSPYQSNTFGSPQPLQQPISAQDLNNNSGRINMGGVQLIPSRLPTGELALVMPNSSNLPYFPTATFPTTPAAHPPKPLDLNPAFPRISAFNSVQKPIPTSAKHPPASSASPPLSPTSSISSGDDSSSSSLPASDFQSQQSSATTPPLQQSPASVFPTPPSGGSSVQQLHHPIASVPVTVQQPQISSTTEPPKTKPLSVITNTNHRHHPDTLASKKRPYPSDGESVGGLLQLSTSEMGNPAKMFKSDGAANLLHNDDLNGDMWRPWWLHLLRMFFFYYLCLFIKFAFNFYLIIICF